MGKLTTRPRETHDAGYMHNSLLSLPDTVNGILPHSRIFFVVLVDLVPDGLRNGDVPKECPRKTSNCAITCLADEDVNGVTFSRPIRV